MNVLRFMRIIFSNVMIKHTFAGLLEKVRLF